MFIPSDRIPPQPRRNTLPREDMLPRERTRRVPAKRPAPTGHEAYLKALEHSGAEVMVEKISTGERIRGTIKCSDKFSVSISAADITRVVFKHDISEFRAITKRAE